MSQLKLREYQKAGVNFLINKDRAFLADDMGLGKTAQVINSMRHLLREKEIRKILIIVPSGLISNWQKEISLWSNLESFVPVKGPKLIREKIYCSNSVVKIASYDSIVNDFEFINDKKINFDLLILDEAQRIKNSNTKIYKACRKIIAKKKWLMTGTPIENSAVELENLIHFIDPKLTLKFDTSIVSLVNILEDKILRRTKENVLKELPDKIEQTVYLDLNGEQKLEYERYLQKTRSKKERKEVDANIFSIITNLKLICNHSSNQDSVKMDYLKTIIQENIDKNFKILIFSQYVKTLEKISSLLTNKSLEIFHYNGSMTKNEKELSIEKFKSSEKKSILLTSIRAGGVGLNLQEATHVILYDRWWNPALEEQAIARAYRMGRKGDLHVLKFIVNDTIENKIEDLITEKREIIDFVDKKAQEFSKGTKEKLLNYILNI